MTSIDLTQQLTPMTSLPQQYFWRVDARGNLLPNYPAEISRFWSNLPKNITHIDAVYERPHDANIVFFIGEAQLGKGVKREGRGREIKGKIQ